MTILYTHGDLLTAPEGTIIKTVMNFRACTDRELEKWMTDQGFIIRNLDYKDESLSRGYVSFIQPDGKQVSSPCFIGSPRENWLLRVWWVRAYLEGYYIGSKQNENTIQNG